MLRALTLIAYFTFTNLQACYLGTLLFIVEDEEATEELVSVSKFTIQTSMLEVPEIVEDVESEDIEQPEAEPQTPIIKRFRVEDSIFDQEDTGSLFGP